VLAENLAYLDTLPDDARVLDVGGWAGPHNRADYVIDVMPYETRGILMPDGFGPGPERFSKDTWVIADLCGHEPWPFEDDFFDFAICTFTLEDLRDPIRTCQEMSRVAKAGYFEVPSVLDELTWWNPEGSGGPWVGHKHHHWLCTWEEGTLVFLHKSHSLHSNWRVRVPRRWADQLSLEERMLAKFWEGELPARERLAIGTYPYDELERAIRERFKPSPAELKAFELREKARGAAGRALAPLKRVATGALDRLGRG
jgi:SAM-dependent methyltransferase